ncbi:MAG: hypothetical protein ABIR96_04445 [Bdellovibrionota bacterium]
MFFKTIVLASFALSFPSFATSAYVKPEGYKVPAIRLRADAGASLNLPSGTYFGLDDALFLDNQDIVAKFLYYAREERSGLLRFSKDSGLDAAFMPNGSFPSGASVNPTSGDFVFEQVNYGYFSEGVMTLSHDFKTLRRSFFDKKYVFTAAPQVVSSEGNVVVRDVKDDATQGLSVVQNGQIQELLSSSARNPKSSYSYLFSQIAQPNGLLALKVRHGTAGQIDESQGDEILLIDLRHSPAVVTSLLQDADLDATSPFTGFDNTGALNANGDIAWIVRLKNGHRALVLKSMAGAPKILVEETRSRIRTFSAFHVSMNPRGDIAFRATDIEGLEGVWRVDANGALFPVIRENDRMKTDQGPALVGVSGDYGGVIFMSPQVNTVGDILVGARLRSDEARTRDIGLGYFVVEPDTRSMQ